MNIDKVVKELFMKFGYGKGYLYLTEDEYRALYDDTVNKYDMSPEELLHYRGLNIHLEYELTIRNSNGRVQ
jgi:hypothetical protein